MLNLTLAVINSKFTEAQNAHQASEAAEAGGDNNQERDMESALH